MRNRENDLDQPSSGGAYNENSCKIMPIYTHSSLKIERMHSKNLMPMQCTQDPVVERFVVDRTQSPRLFSHRALGMKSSFMCSLGSCHSFSG